MTDDTTPLRTFQNILCCLGGTYVEKGGVMCAYGGPSDPQLCTAGVLRTPCRGTLPAPLCPLRGLSGLIGTAQWPYYSLNLRYT